MLVVSALLLHLNVNAQNGDTMDDQESSIVENNVNNGRSFVTPPKVSINHATGLLLISNPSNNPCVVTIVNPMGFGIYSAPVNNNEAIYLNELTQNTTGIYQIRIKYQRATFSFTLML